MAYLELQTAADYTVHESFEVQTSDYEDHSFCGIIFDVVVKDLLPVEYLEIRSVSVRGMLGSMSVWWCEGTHEGYFDDRERWNQVFSGFKDPSPNELVALDLEPKICVKAGERIGLYIHSRRADDQAIVYDNKRRDASHEDRFLQILPGAAHISNRPFSSRGWWGYGWRPDREFVGKINSGVRYVLWKPRKETHKRFPPKFRRAAFQLLLCAMKKGCVLTWVPLEISYFILNMCSWNWFGDGENDELDPSSSSATMVTDDDGGIGWHSHDYRSRIEAHMRSSHKIQRFENLRRQDDEEEDDESYEDDDFDDEDEGEDDDDDDDEDEDEDEDEKMRVYQQVSECAQA